ncbi:MAG: hypothetical protein FD126_559 [Elusimicrobia bacterium]|nr:MAG: hypothetical protein FD126_559 [Elusimicrobiota bacterium]
MALEVSVPVKFEAVESWAAKSVPAGFALAPQPKVSEPAVTTDTAAVRGALGRVALVSVAV